MRTLAAIVVTLLALTAQQRPLSSIAADLEKLIVELRAALPVSSSTITVPAGGNVQAALNAAKPGDTIVLLAGVRYVTGELQLPAKAGTVTLRSSATLPDRRITPADAALLPRLASGNLGMVINGTGASHWKFDGIAFESTSSGHGEILVFEGASQITLDRILIVAGPNGQKRAIRGNATHISLTRSHIANIWKAGQDSQAFCAWEGAGPYTLTNNYLEASGENVMFGGSDNYLLGAASNPADVLIEGNDFYKPESWRALAGTGIVKNLLELKNCTRCTIRQNTFEGNWTDAQPGWSIVLTPVNQDGRAPWTVVKDVLFERNWLKRAERGINMLGKAYQHVTQPTSGIVFRQNLIEVDAQCFQFSGEMADLTIEDNVCINGYNIATIYAGGVRDSEEGPIRDAKYAVGQLAFSRNVARHNEYGIIGGGIGTAALTTNTQRFTFPDNRFVGLKGTYPATTVNITEAELQAAKAALLKALGR